MWKFHPLARGIIFGTFLARAGFFMSLPFLGIYLHEAKGIDPATTGAILGVSFFVSTFAGFIGGTLSDRVGRFSLLLFSMVLWGMVFIGFALAESVWFFFVLNALNGLCRAVFEPIARALLTDVTSKEERVAVFNARYFAINAGGAIGPLIGLGLGASKSSLPFFISALIYFVYGLIILKWMFHYKKISKDRTSLPDVSFGHSLKVVAKDKVFTCFLLGNIFVTGGYSHLDTTLAQYFGHHHLKVYSLLFVANMVYILLFQYPIVRMMKRFSALTSLKAGCLLFGLGLFGFGMTHTLPLLMLSMFLFTAGEILCFIIGDVLISDIAPDHLRGAYFGASGLQFLGQGASAWAGGVLLNVFGFSHGIMIFGILAGLTVAAFPFFEYGEKLSRRNKKSNSNTWSMDTMKS